MSSLLPLFRGAFLLYFFLSCSDSQEEIVKLPSHFHINPNYITLSGFNSGGTFAQQMYLSYSSLFRGLAVFAHTYYRCGPIHPSQDLYDDACTQIGNESTYWDFNNVFHDIDYYVSNGLIEDPRTIRNKPLYVWAGLRNWLLSADMSLKLLQLYEGYIQNPQMIRTVVQDANLTFPTNRPEHEPCGAQLTNRLLLNNCGRSGAFEALQWLLGHEAVIPPSPGLRLQPLLTFDQTEFFYGFEGGSSSPLMYPVGYLYVPKVCKRNGAHCHLHFYFHGCWVSSEFVDDQHIKGSGFLEVAEANGIIMVFPQALSSRESPIGCWDTHGITGPLYATQQGAQVTVVRNMIARLLNQEGHLSHASASKPQSQLVPSLPNALTSTDFPLHPQSHSDFFQDFLKSNAHRFSSILP